MKTNPETKVCSHCQTSIPFKAKKCPQCQSDLRSAINKHPILTLLIFTFIVVPVMVAVVSDDGSQTSSTNTPSGPTHNRTAAYRQTRDLVKSVLKSPASADFPLTPSISNVTDTSFTLSSYVDAQNSFGANIRSYFTADFIDSNGSDPIMTKLVFDGKTIYKAK